MGCCNNNIILPPIISIQSSGTYEEGPISESIKNLRKAIKTQDNKFLWILTGVKGLVKCVLSKTSYSDDDIIKNREICSQCEFASNKDNEGITMTSQCMAKDPITGEMCGCYLMCLTQIGPCKLNKFVSLTINNK